MWKVLSLVFGSLLAIITALSAVYYARASTRISDYEGVIANIQDSIGGLAPADMPGAITSLQQDLTSTQRTVSFLQSQNSSLQITNTANMSHTT